MQSTAFHQSKHMLENELDFKNDTCTYCGGKNLSQVIKLQISPRVDLLECMDCGLGLASRFPTKDALDRYYSSYYSKDKPSITNDNHIKFAKHIYRHFNNNLNTQTRTIRILDFGGGDGSISYEVAKLMVQSKGIERVDISVVDYESGVINSSLSTVNICHAEDLNLLDSNYDFVIASAVLEHIPKSKEVLEALESKLVRKGMIYIRTPYIAPLMTLFEKLGLNLDFTYPGHIYDMGELFWNNYCKNKSFTIQISQPSMVESSFRNDFFRALSAHILKYPWSIIGSKYKYVGGWEVVYEV